MSDDRSRHHLRTGEIIRALFAIVIETPGIRAGVATSQLAAQMPLSQEELLRVAWGATGARKAGWFASGTHGRWTVTEAGRRAFDLLSEPEEFHRELDRLYVLWKNQE